MTASVDLYNAVAVAYERGSEGNTILLILVCWIPISNDLLQVFAEKRHTGRRYKGYLGLSTLQSRSSVTNLIARSWLSTGISKDKGLLMRFNINLIALEIFRIDLEAKKYHEVDNQIKKNV